MRRTADPMYNERRIARECTAAFLLRDQFVNLIVFEMEILQCASPEYISPASMGASSMFWGGGSGQVAYGVKAHGGL